MAFEVPQSFFLPASLVVAFLVTRLLTKKSDEHLPPGPKKKPLIGNLLDMPMGKDWEVYQKYAKDADSDIIHLQALGQSIVVLNSYKVAQDLLDKRSALYSSRPHFTMFHELSGWGFLFSVFPYGDQWRACRRTFTKHFTPSNTSLNRPKEIMYVRRLLGELLKKPEDFLAHTRTLVASTTLSMTYGIKVRPTSDPYVELAEEAAATAAPLLVAGSFLVDIIPWMKYIPAWFPGAKFQRTAQTMREHASMIRNRPFAASQEMLRKGEYEPAFVTDALKDVEYAENKEEEIEVLKDIAGQVFMAGADTTASALGSFFLAMVCHPEVQKKAQEELDRVIGTGRLPEHEDFEKLPYLTAVVYETYRWKPVTPLGVPHQLVGDDVYEGYAIPKDTIVIANQWAILHDEKLFPDPFSFRPERFLTETGQIDKTVRNPMDAAFGFGRRICPGKYIAHSTLMLATSSILSTFDLHKAKDAQGNVLEPAQEYHETLIVQPKNFPCVIKPRSRQAKELIVASVE